MKTLIKMETLIKAPIDRCFDLSRSIDLHVISTKDSRERAIAGRTSGLMALGETVTWEARHFFIYQTLTTKITSYHHPYHFKDVMVQGAFENMEHDHLFKSENGTTIMTDIFVYNVPYGILGSIFDLCVLKRYMAALLRHRNAVIKNVAESNTWTQFTL
ncbi:MAG: cell division protein [Marivirga sp.]|nr:cell division protein [Marivirga sp.]